MENVEGTISKIREIIYMCDFYTFFILFTSQLWLFHTFNCFLLNSYVLWHYQAIPKSQSDIDRAKIYQRDFMIQRHL